MTPVSRSETLDVDLRSGNRDAVNAQFVGYFVSGTGPSRRSQSLTTA